MIDNADNHAGPINVNMRFSNGKSEFHIDFSA